MTKWKKMGLAVGTIVILGAGSYVLAKYNTDSYAHILYKKVAFPKKITKTNKNVSNSVQNRKKINDLTNSSDSITKKLKKEGFEGSYAVIENGKVSENKMVGKKLANGKLYQIGNTENLLTAAAISELVKQGKLSLDTPVNKFYGDSLDVSKKVTIRSLLDMTSGITNNSVPNNQLQRSDDVLQWNLNHAIVSSPGIYNNQEINYVLLEGIVSQVSGMPYQSYIINTFFKPNKLNNIEFINNLSDSKMITPNDGGQSISNADLAKAMNAQMGSNQLMASPQDYLKLVQIFVEKYENSQGFFVKDSEKKTGQIIQTGNGYEVSGGLKGYKVAVLISKNGDKGIALMSNSSNGSEQESDNLLAIAKNTLKNN